MEHTFDTPTANSVSCTLASECEPGTVPGIGSISGVATVTNPGGNSTRNAKEQEFLDSVLGTMRYARHSLPQYPNMRDEIEYWNWIVEAWQEFTGKEFYQGELEDEEWEKELEKDLKENVSHSHPSVLTFIKD